jgi:hypothetical protein
MALPSDIEVTSEMLWQGTLLFALIDLGFVPLLAWRIKRTRFRQLKWALVIATAIVWSMIWMWALNNFWDSVYRHFFPDWTRPFLPLFFGLLYAVVALVFWWGALRFSGNPVVGFCLFGGLWGMATHVWAVYRGIVDKPPMLQGASPVAAVVIAVFEFMFYWCIILNIAWLLRRGWQWSKGLIQGQARVV